MNNTILPITDAIIGYLQKQRLEEEKKNYIKDILPVFNEPYIDEIEEQRKKERAYIKLKRLTIEARKTNKNNIWIYEQMVLAGYGYEIDYHSELYQDMLEIYQEMYNIKIKKLVN